MSGKQRFAVYGGQNQSNYINVAILHDIFIGHNEKGAAKNHIITCK